MSICDISVINFKALRYSHDISAANLANVLELKSSASITNIEKGKAAHPMNCSNAMLIRLLFPLIGSWDEVKQYILKTAY